MQKEHICNFIICIWNLIKVDHNSILSLAGHRPQDDEAVEELLEAGFLMLSDKEYFPDVSMRLCEQFFLSISSMLSGA